jgi:hypothetical protein
MQQANIEQDKSTGPNALLDHLRELAGLKNDAALARKLEVAPPVISKLRHYKLPLGDSLLLNMHETFGVPVAEMREKGSAPRMRGTQA